MIPSRIGQVIGGRYQVQSVVGEGGQCVVYKAVDVRDGDEIALKVLKEDYATDPDARERMFREASAMAQLQGTSAVRVYDQQWTADGALCLVVELLHGSDLEEFLRAIEAKGARLQVPALRVLFTPVVDTLEAAHRMGIVHRDLKPGNVFIIDAAHGGGVRLLDFGFAKFTRIRSFTAHGMLAGSPKYIAPEAWREQGVDHRADVYALGAMIFRTVSGQAPFDSPNLVDLMQKVLTAPRPSLYRLRPDLPRDVDDWVLQALALDPKERFMNVRPLWNAFCSVLGI